MSVLLQGYRQASEGSHTIHYMLAPTKTCLLGWNGGATFTQNEGFVKRNQGLKELLR